MVSGNAASMARAMPGPATADTPANAIAKAAPLLSLMIGLLLLNWHRGGWDADQLDPNEAALAVRETQPSIVSQCSVFIPHRENVNLEEALGFEPASRLKSDADEALAKLGYCPS
jgi:hypothetical protein